MSATSFDLLGLPRRFALDQGELERHYLARSRELHPDFHQMSGAAEQRASLAMSARLNEAYLILRDPFRRAEYLLSLEGGPSAAEHKTMDPAFLQEMLDVRMQMQEVLEDNDPNSQARGRMEQEVRGRRDKLVGDLEHEFEQLETLPVSSEGRRPALLRIRQVLNTARYVEGLLRDLKGG
jgi:molecular chaperone HscB